MAIHKTALHFTPTEDERGLDGESLGEVESMLRLAGIEALVEEGLGDEYVITLLSDDPQDDDSAATVEELITQAEEDGYVEPGWRWAEL